VNLSRLKAPLLQAPEIPDQVLFEEGKGRLGWGFLVYQVLPSLLQPPELHPDGDPDTLREWPLAKQMGN